MPSPGQIFGNYRVVRPLGTGGFAEVYEAEDPLLERRVALKILLPQFARTEDVLARFQREVRAVAALNHPGIVPIYAVGGGGDEPNYYAMRLLPGGDLRKHIDKGITPSRALSIVAELADALDHAHAQGIIHRDIKPENILFDEDDHPVLTDFGIAKVLWSQQEQLTAAGTSIGTPRYLSPEQARGGQLDARTDLYSLGVILFEMLTGKRPFDAPDPLSVVLMHATEPVPKLPAEHSALQPLIDQLMAKLPAQRPASATELRKLAQGYRRAYRDEATPARAAPIRPTPKPAAAPAVPPAPAAAPSASRPAPTAPTAKTPDTGKRRGLGITAAGLVLVAAAVGAWVLWPETASTPAPDAIVAAVPAVDGEVDKDVDTRVDAEPETSAVSAAGGTAPAESLEQRVARERKRCALHVSALTGGGNLVYDDALRFPGARKESDGSGIRVPNVQLGNGQWVNALVTPDGCVLIRSLAAGPAPAQAP